MVEGCQPGFLREVRAAMNIQGSSSVASQLVKSELAATQTEAQIATAIAKKQMDAQRQTGEAMVQLIQQAAGRGVDLRA